VLFLVVLFFAVLFFGVLFFEELAVLRERDVERVDFDFPAVVFFVAVLDEVVVLRRLLEALLLDLLLLLFVPPELLFEDVPELFFFVEDDDLRAVEAPPFLPPFFMGEWSSFLPRPDPAFFPPPLTLFTVAQARLSASFFETPRSS
jgi:hypothetical protein